MHETTRSIIRFYILSAVWFATSLGMTFAALGPVDIVLFEVVDASAVVRASTALAIGIVTASLVTWMLWVSFPVRRSRRATADQREQVPATVFGSTLR